MYKDVWTDETVYVKKKGVWGQRPQQAKACAEGKGSELASDPCRRHGQKLVLDVKQNRSFYGWGR